MVDPGSDPGSVDPGSGELVQRNGETPKPEDMAKSHLKWPNTQQGSDQGLFANEHACLRRGPCLLIWLRTQGPEAGPQPPLS